MTLFAKAVVLAAMSLPALASAATPVWSYETSEHPMGGLIKRAIIDSNTPSSTDEFTAPPARLILLEQSGANQVLVQVKSAQLRCYPSRPCQLKLRIDEAAAESVDAVALATRSPAVLAMNGQDLPARIASANRVRIQVPALTGIDALLEFKTEGLDRDQWLTDDLGVSTSPAPPPENSAPGSIREAATVLLAVLLLIIAVPLYFLPAALARHRRTASATTVILFNVLLGWTIIGWAVAMAMALAAKSGRRAPGHMEIADLLRKK